MKTKNIILSVSIITAMLISSGCSLGVDVPDELKDSSSSKADTSSGAPVYNDSRDTNDSEYETITLSDLAQNKQSEIDRIYSLNCDNFTFSDGIDFIVPEVAGKYHIEGIEGFGTHANQLFDKYVPDDVYDARKITTDEHYVPFGPCYQDEELGLRVDTGKGGFFIYVPMGSDKENNPETEYSQYYYINGVMPDETVTLDGEQVKISQLWDKTSDFLEGFKECAEYDGDFIPYIAAVGKTENGENQEAEILFRSSINGLPLNCLGKHRMYEGDVDPDIREFHTARCNYINGDELYYLSIQKCMQVKGTIEEYDSIISPSSAVKLLSDKLSGYSQYEVIGLELAYSQINCKEDKSVMPFWFIYFDLTPNYETFGMVNAITGEVTFVKN